MSNYRPSLAASELMLPVGLSPNAESLTPWGLAQAQQLGGLVLDLVASEASRASDGLCAPAEAARRIEAQGYVRLAPWFRDQLADTSRTNTFVTESYDGSRRLTEHEGLLELSEFLQNAYGTIAEGMLENLTFIGERELAEGVAGLAAYWKKLLDDNPNLQLCVLANISAHAAKIKSDAYLRERIFEHFSDEELANYRGRLFTRTDQLSETHENVTIVLLDDWIISGQQMETVYTYLPERILQEYGDRVEAHVITATQRQLTNRVYGGYGIRLPVRSYFLSHSATESARHGAHVSGTHSAVDYDFSGLIDSMTPKPGHPLLRPPALRRLAPQYRGLHCVQAERVERLAS